jgi:GT2 family glycosyltransferase
VIQVAILIVTYNGSKYLEELFRSLCAAERSGFDVRVYVVDNSSIDASCDQVRRCCPEAILIESSENLGFAGGNNRGWQKAAEDLPQCDYLYLLNQDTVVDRNFLVEAVAYLESHPEPGAAQSLLLLHPEIELINTAGNRLHFLGFGLPSFYRTSNALAPDSGVIAYPSGAAVLVRCDLLRQWGLFHPDLFLYLEDAELGLKLHLAGHPPHICRSSVVYHKYEFGTTIGNYFYLERNRLWLLAVHFQFWTLIKILPAVFLMEFGQFLYALRHGLVMAKLKASCAFMNPGFLARMLRQRRVVQSGRVVDDREIFPVLSDRVESPHLDSWLLRRVANPFFAFYFRCLCRTQRRTTGDSSRLERYPLPSQRT